MQFYNLEQKQRLIISILCALSDEEKQSIQCKLKGYMDKQEYAVYLDYLFMCINRSRKINSCTYVPFPLEEVLKEIFSVNGELDNNRSFVNELEKHGIYQMKLNRVKRGMAELYMADAIKIVSDYCDPIARYFWINELHLSCPNMSVIKDPEMDVDECIRFFVSFIPSGKMQIVQTSLTDCDLAILSSVIGEKNDSFSKLGIPPYKLYAIIEEQLHRLKLKHPDFEEDEIEISKNSWAKWKKEWRDAEGEMFKNGPPECRLQRQHILYMIVRFNFSLMEANVFMALAGYSFSDSDTEKDIRKYLCTHFMPEAEMLGLIKIRYNAAPKYANFI